MTGLGFERSIISLDGVLDVQLGINMLGRKYSTKECVCMAKAFLLHLMGTYLFANGGQTVSLRWLTLF